MSLLLRSVLWLVPVALALLWRPRARPGPMALALLIVYASLGAWLLWFGVYGLGVEPAAFVHWKPTVLYWLLAAVSILAPLLGYGYPARILIGAFFALSNREWRWINGGLAAIFTVLGAVNLIVAREASERDWVGFKYSAQMMLLIVILMRINFATLPVLAEVSIHAWGHLKRARQALGRLWP
jgi:intracellular septation protein A